MLRAPVSRRHVHPATARFLVVPKTEGGRPARVAHNAWARTAIDNFILAKLQTKGLTPNPAADKTTLLRRATLDLTGLPPTPEELDAFVADRSPQAFEKVVDRLLASPQYGERWGRHWLDLARFAESEGFKADEIRPNAWRYRDYVIQSFNQDKPYNRFVEEQIAGDELWPDDPQARVATGFHRHYPDESNARNLYQRRQEILDDITDTTGAVFMGLTYGCARCHNHKFDPILQADYYRLQAFFANTAANDHIPMLPAGQLAEYRQKQAAWEEKTAAVRAKIAALLEPSKQKISADYFEKYPAEIQAMILKPAAQRSPYEGQMWAKAKPYLETPDADAAKQLPAAQKKEYEVLKAELAKFDDIKPPEFPEGMGMADLGRTAPPTHVLAVGVYNNPKEEVQPGFLTLLDPTPAKIVPPHGTRIHRPPHRARKVAHRSRQSAHRARDGQSHLAASFRPRHRRHAQRFRHHGRAAHPSRTARLADPRVREQRLEHEAHAPPDHDVRGLPAVHGFPRSRPRKSIPTTGCSGRIPRQRLEGEVIRDAALMVSGSLNLKVGGPSVFPDLPDGMGALRGGWKLSAADERNRRSVYIFVQAQLALSHARGLRHAGHARILLAPRDHHHCAASPDHAQRQGDARVGAGLRRASPGRPKIPCERAFRLAYLRSPDPWEKDTVADLLPQAAGCHFRARRQGREARLAVPIARRDRPGCTPRHSWISVTCCSTPTSSSMGIKP